MAKRSLLSRCPSYGRWHRKTCVQRFFRSRS